MRPKSVLLSACVLLVLPGLLFAQTEWVDDPVNPVIVHGDLGVWAAGNWNPLGVIEVDGIYHLYFNGQAAGSQEFLNYDIGHATSTDGVAWEMDPANPVLTRGAQGTWDDRSLWGVAVIHDGSQFKLWYCGLHDDSMLKRGGYATSPDGTVWTKHPTWVIDVGPPGSWDATEVKPQAVIYGNGLYRMWYSGASVWNGPHAERDWQIGYAESVDGLVWTKTPANPVLGRGVGWEGQYVYGPSVLHDGTLYHLWYSGSSGSSIDSGYAVSSDGIGWTRSEWNPVLLAPAGEGFDLPQVLFDGVDSFTMWYHALVARSGRLATSDCCPEFIFVGGFESGDTTAWSSTAP